MASKSPYPSWSTERREPNGQEPTPSLLPQQHPNIVLKGRQGLRTQSCQLPLEKAPFPSPAPPSPRWVSLPMTFPCITKKGPGRVAGCLAPTSLWGAQLRALRRLFEAPRARKRMCVPGRSKVEPSQASSCSGYSRCLPGTECKGLATRELPVLSHYPSPRCILNGQPAHGLCFLPGEALKAAWAGARCRSRTSREAKSAPGPSTRTQVASVNSFWLIGGRRGCLPSGRPWRAGGWEGLRGAALELEGPSSSHLLQLLAMPGRRGPG